jgi:hypothetical protein
LTNGCERDHRHRKAFALGHGDELPKGQAVAASPWDMIIQFATLGVRAQTSGYGGDRFGFTPGAPHEDAIVVADAMRALKTDAAIL